MAKTETKPFAKETTEADAILTKIGTSVVNLTADVVRLAAVVAKVRGSIMREVKSKRTDKAVTVPDWDGRSPSYREWFNDTLLPLIAQRIPAEYQGTIRTRLQNAVQDAVKKSATPAQLAHLGLSKTNKKAVQQSKRTAAKKTAENGRQSDESFTTDALVAYVKDTPLQDGAQAIAAMSEAFSKNVTANKASMTKSQRDKSNALIGQAIQHLMSARSNLMPAPAAPKDKEKIAA